MTVRAGYARNHLIPAGRAALASKANRAAYQRTDDEARRPVVLLVWRVNDVVEGSAKRCKMSKVVTSGHVHCPGKTALRC